MTAHPLLATGRSPPTRPMLDARFWILDAAVFVRIESERRKLPNRR